LSSSSGSSSASGNGVHLLNSLSLKLVIECSFRIARLYVDLKRKVEANALLMDIYDITLENHELSVHTKVCNGVCVTLWLFFCLLFIISINVVF
jgi:hypothetical protein